MPFYIRKIIFKQKISTTLQYYGLARGNPVFLIQQHSNLYFVAHFFNQILVAKDRQTKVGLVSEDFSSFLVHPVNKRVYKSLIKKQKSRCEKTKRSG